MFHIGSHNVTCHPAEVTFLPLPQPIKDDTRFSDPGGMQGCRSWPSYSFVTYRGDMPILTGLNVEQLRWCDGAKQMAASNFSKICPNSGFKTEPFGGQTTLSKKVASLAIGKDLGQAVHTCTRGWEGCRRQVWRLTGHASQQASVAHPSRWAQGIVRRMSTLFTLLMGRGTITIRHLEVTLTGGGTEWIVEWISYLGLQESHAIHAVQSLHAFRAPEILRIVRWIRRNLWLQLGLSIQTLLSVLNDHVLQWRQWDPSDLQTTPAGHTQPAQ